MCTYEIKWFIVASQLQKEVWAALQKSRVVILTAKNDIGFFKILDIIQDVTGWNIWSLLETVEGFRLRQNKSNATPDIL